jgi:hypothetical protein
MKSHALLTILMALCLTAAECKRGSGPVTPILSPEDQATQIRHAVVNYLSCEECEGSELDTIVRLGEVVVPTFAATLREGPPQGNLELLRRQLTASYRELKEYERTHPEVKVPGSEGKFVKTYMDNHVALHQARAAIALAAIGGAEAKRALEEASRKPLRSDVQAVVKEALEKIK